MEPKYVVYFETDFRVLTLHVAVFVKETPKMIKIKKSDLDVWCFRAVLSKEYDKYIITDKKTAMKALYFSKQYRSMYDKTTEVIREQYMESMNDLMEHI